MPGDADEDIGLSPNGKATDSDSVIFKVRILVALLRFQYNAETFFLYKAFISKVSRL